ncbi:hypothetical protein GA0070616_3825 [Micromonospora nigra]|uniref:Uncharacterized protein n=1 Tax=Micromonospora nigra TaxID=145857 RepID=A0A1C6SHZ3_9ACTN|nr:hypothetical protein [Micromonospora nigra]SCL29130.1 hypothetical protein GA0070616_3825 [Micromonospora nigra]
MSHTPPAARAALVNPASRAAVAALVALAARAALVVVGMLAALAATAAPALAHGADAPDGTDYRVSVTSLEPADAGLRVRVVEAGARLELTSTGGRTVEVVGYSGEPYLRVGPDGVYENLRSPATYLNRTIAGQTRVPAEANPAAPPDWRRIGDGPTARWHDQRALWLEAAPPAPVRADPDREHRVRDWVVPLRVGGEAGQIRGALDWVPPPDAYTWWVGITLGALAVGAAGLLPAASRPGGRALRGLGGLLVAGGTAGVVLVVGRELDAGAEGVGGVLLGLLGGQVWALLTAVGAVVAGGWALARRPAAELAVALAGACLALFAGVANAAVLGTAVAPSPWPATLARLLVAVTLITGAGVLAAAALRLHATGRTPKGVAVSGG